MFEKYAYCKHCGRAIDKYALDIFGRMLCSNDDFTQFHEIGELVHD